jgi:hypothetical protein
MLSKFFLHKKEKNSAISLKENESSSSPVVVRAYFDYFHYHPQGCGDGNRHSVIALRRQTSLKKFLFEWDSSPFIEESCLDWPPGGYDPAD